MLDSGVNLLAIFIRFMTRTENRFKDKASVPVWKMKVRKQMKVRKSRWRWETQMKVRNVDEGEKRRWRWETQMKVRKADEGEKRRWRWEKQMKVRNADEGEKSRWRWETQMKVRKADEGEKRRWRRETVIVFRGGSDCVSALLSISHAFLLCTCESGFISRCRTLGTCPHQKAVIVCPM